MEKFSSLEEVKKIELNILKQVHDFCEEKSLKYVLAYGTLIGAIRHNGFIPWDDDIDIWMPRKDYDLFMEVFPEWGAGRHLYIAGPQSDQYYLPRHMIKVCDDRTLLLENKYKAYKTTGLFIDIFPLDNAPDNMLERKIWAKYVRSYKYRVLAGNISFDSPVYKKFSISKKIFTVLLSRGNIKKINSKFVKKAGKYKEKTTDYVTVFYVSKPRVYSIEDIFPPSLHVFEDAQFYIPKAYDKILKSIYGDYMQLPPEEERIPIHTADAYYTADKEFSGV